MNNLFKTIFRIIICFGISGMSIAWANPDLCLVAQKFNGPHKALHLTTVRCEAGYIKYNSFVRRSRGRGMNTMWVRCAHNNCAIAKRMVIKYVGANKGRLPLKWHKMTLPKPTAVHKKYTCLIARRWHNPRHLRSRLKFFTVGCYADGPVLGSYRRKNADIMWVKCGFNQCTRARRAIIRYVNNHGRLPFKWTGKTL